MKALFPAAVVILAGCAVSSSDVEITEIAPSELPSTVMAAISAERGDFTVVEVLKKVRDGRIYYDVEGVISDGSELEFDVLLDGESARVVETQRDLVWADVPADVRTLALEVSGGVEPVRIIESLQTDGAIIYELFAAGQPGDPAFEIGARDGAIELLDERWMH
ncbi:MAG: hypothetical protein AAF216_11505 [Pseudomonadota bacterium]